ncbi:MAG: TadE/TadG family type IV pilus assembly protein [Pseudomonadota bacterium]
MTPSNKFEQVRATLKRPLRSLAHLRKENSGVAFIEFAFAAPIFLSLGLMGTETAYYVITHMQVSQVAMQVADNASRVGEADVLEEKRVFEDDITEVFVGAEKLGAGIGVFEQGRIILSSLQQNSEGGQWIAWQRCRGKKNHTSSYGLEDEGKTGTAFEGMGANTTKIKSSAGTAVMFVEISYTYESLTPFNFLEGRVIDYTAAFNIRDSRDLTRLYGASDGQAVASCTQFTA